MIDEHHTIWPYILKPPFLIAGRRQSFKLRASSFSGAPFVSREMVFVSAAPTMIPAAAKIAAISRGFLRFHLSRVKMTLLSDWITQFKVEMVAT